MNPESLADPVRLNTDWMFRLPTLVRPELLDAVSFEDTETALARFLPPVRFGSPRPNRTGGSTPPPTPAEANRPPWTIHNGHPTSRCRRTARRSPV